MALSIQDAFIAAPSLRVAPAASDEGLRRHFVHCVWVLYALLLTEGILRKWVFPEFSQYVFFIRDPVVIYAYTVAFRCNAFRPVPPVLAVGLLFAFLMIPIVAIQATSGVASGFALFAAYGWRNYFLYLPLPFAMARLLSRQDLYLMCRLTVYAVILIAPLAVAQYFAAPGAAINVGNAEDAKLQFVQLGSANGHIRPPGTFTSILGMVELTSSALAVLLVCWILPRSERPISHPVLILGAVAVAASLAVSGSRTMIFHALIVVAFAVASGLLMRRPALIARATIMPSLLTAAFVILYPIVFPEAFDTLTTRWQQASEGEHGVQGRVLGETLEFTWLLPDAPLLGYGLGLGGNAANILKASNTATVPYSETDWAHQIVDLGPVLGILFIIYRMIFTVWLAISSIQATRRAANPLPALLFGYVGIVLLQGQIAGNGVENGFCWLFVGFCMAACRLPSTAQASVADDSRPAPTLRPRNLMT
jgi:hypothetical protein